MKAYFRTSICFPILSMVILIGCGGETKTDTNSGPDTDNTRSARNTKSLDSQEGGTKNDRSKVSIPDDFPKDIYIAEGATDAKETGGTGNLILEYPESDIDAFIKSYREGMVEKGWTQLASSKLPIGTITNFSKDDRKCTISISPPKDNVIKVAIVLRGDNS